MKCPNPECEIDSVPENLRNCPACETFVEFPNVRAAQDPDNIRALDERAKDAYISTTARKCNQRLKDFEAALESSKAILCLKYSPARLLFESDNQLLNTFYQQISSKRRTPESNKWDRGREVAEAKIFPNYYKDLHYACLSLDENILGHYGDVALIFKEGAISKRSAVFEKNVILFCEEHRLTPLAEIPQGYRAIWALRGKLAIAKLHPRIDESTESTDFQRILVFTNAPSGEEDFIEVTIYGMLHRKSVEKVLVKKPKRSADEGIWLSFSESLKKDGVTVEMI